MSNDDVFEQVKEAIKDVEWAGKPDPSTMTTPNKHLGEYMQDVLAAVDRVKQQRAKTPLASQLVEDLESKDHE